MVTKNFIEPFYIKTINLIEQDSEYGVIIKAVGDGITEGEEFEGIVGQIVKATFTDCIPLLGMRYSDNLPEIYINNMGNLEIEEPTYQINIFEASKQYPEEKIYGLVTIHYWFPSIEPEYTTNIVAQTIQSNIEGQSWLLTIGNNEDAAEKIVYVNFYINNDQIPNTEEESENIKDLEKYYITLTYLDGTCSEPISLAQSGYYELDNIALADIASISVGAALNADLLKEVKSAEEGEDQYVVLDE